jgi:hypothetical protein
MLIDLNILIAFQIRYRAGKALGFNVAGAGHPPADIL